ncbi:MAG: Arm DNA-binding domain-containing protein [Methylocystis sp.]
MGFRAEGIWRAVRPSGARSYVVMYRPAGEARRAAVRRVTIDTVGKITPDEARRAAKRIVGLVAHGEDPAAERVSAVRRQWPTFRRRSLPSMWKPSGSRRRRRNTATSTT